MIPRLRLIKLGFILFFLTILTRLFYWQVISRDHLSLAAIAQRADQQLVPAERGQILSSDGYALVTNQPDFLLYGYLPQLNQPIHQIATNLSSLTLDPPQDATQAAIPHEVRLSQEKSRLLDLLSDPAKKWVPLKRHLNANTKESIEALGVLGLGFDRQLIRYYPEASMSAHLLGFVSQDDQGQPIGYFGLEGKYDLELRGKPGLISRQKDATGKPILIGDFQDQPARDGRTLHTHIDRILQHKVETALKEGLEKYSAVSGEVAVMDPFTGAILAMASFPAYHPAAFIDYPAHTYKNPLIANAYEPGSTFKVLVMAAAINENAITPETKCDQTCAGPVQIGKYSIRTWNNQYNPGQTMTDVLSRSDNTGMIFTAFKLGKDKFVDYLEKFGLGQLTGIDLQEESTPSLRQKWGDIDLATSSFGQGIAVTGIQMLSAVAAIANGGELVMPQVVSKVEDAGQMLEIKPHVVRRVISPDAARQVSLMMEEAAHHGEAQWAVLKDYRVAGKTGTAQIPIAGHYDSEKTIASFIGFAPVDQPKFVMLVKLSEPQSSPWASETAAPLWFDLAHQILLHYNVPPQS